MIRTVYGEVQDEQVSGVDVASQFAVDWWATKGWQSGTFDEANRLARAKGTSVDEVACADVITSRGNVVRLLESPVDAASPWTPGGDRRATAWEGVHHLAGRLIEGGGEVVAAELLQQLQDASLADSVRVLTYRLASIASSTKRTKDEERYNALIEAWPSTPKPRTTVRRAVLNGDFKP